jgi:hypothetical protein
MLREAKKGRVHRFRGGVRHCGRHAAFENVSGFATSDLVKIAAAGSSHVVFEF